MPHFACATRAISKAGARAGRLLACLGLAASALLATPLWAAGGSCNPEGTQAELNACAVQTLKRADAELNEIYGRIREANRDDKVRLRQLQAAQQLWLKQRDADLKALFSLALNENPQAKYGSVYFMEYAYAKARMTEDRARWLRTEFLENANRP
jgi:hypothetical protein